MARKGKQSLADTVDESEIIESGEITSEPNILIDDEWGIRGGYRDYALVTKKIAHRTGKEEDGENCGKVIRYTKWEDINYAPTVFKCLQNYFDYVNLSKFKQLKFESNFNKVTEIYESTQSDIRKCLKEISLSKATTLCGELIDEIDKLRSELDESRAVIKEINDFREEFKKSRQILIKDTEPKKHRTQKEKE